MKKSCCLRHLLSLAIITASVTLHSCMKDVFDPEKVKTTYQDKFPVKDIDPSMDWKTTNPITVNISVFQDAGVDYKIRIYDSNPLSENSAAQLLAEGTVNNTLSFITIMDCPSILNEVFVCCIDAHNRAIVKYATITSSHLQVSFGTQTATRASGQGVEIPIYSPSKSADQIEALLANAIEIDENTRYESGGVYKISEGRTYKSGWQNKVEIFTKPVATIIVAGTWEPTSIIELEDGYELYVLNRGSINLGENTLMIKNSTHYIVYAGGKIVGTGNSNINVTNSSNGNYNYNAGSIDIPKIADGGNYYNAQAGIFKVKDLAISVPESQFINHGTAIVGNTHDNTTIQNACSLTITEKCNGNLVMGNNSAATIKEYTVWNKNITLGNNSMITMDNASFNNTTFVGSDKPSLIKVGNLVNIQLGEKATTGNVYFEFKGFKKEWTTEDWRKMNKLTYFAKWGEAPVIIPSGDCTGEGNTPGEGSDKPTNPIKYTYVFEDNYPLVGDYDFNDIVLDVAISHEQDNNGDKITKTHIDVTLAAIGANKALGAGLRLIGISKGNVKVSTSGEDKMRFETSLTDEQSLISNTIEVNDPQIIVPLFGNAHKVLGAENGKIVNTEPTGFKATPRTYNITIEYSNQSKDPLITKDNLDFFICYQYRNMNKRMEVHLYEFWKYGSTAAGTIQQENLDLAGNNTWAISVPNFRYPIERVNICDTKNENNSAYPKFMNWVKDHNSSKDWYLYPNEANVYR